MCFILNNLHFPMGELPWYYFEVKTIRPFCPFISISEKLFKHPFYFSHPSQISYRVFFSTKKICTLLKKNAILCLFLKNVSPSKTVVCVLF